jgi:GT2 family glycosyltransferase
VVVTHQSERHLPRLLADLRAASDRLRLRIVLVDNASTDGTARAAGASGAIVLLSEDNLGYAGGLNLAWPHVAPDAPVLVLNPDVALEPGAVEHLLAAAARPGVGVAVPMLRDEDGGTARSLRREPSVVRAVVDALLGRHARGLPGALSETVWDEAAYRSPGTPDWACGAVLLITQECLRRVGPWDSGRFFLYSEETDFFRRVRESGLRTAYEPRAVATHTGGGSGASPALVALMAVNRVRYAGKHRGRAVAVAHWCAVVLHEALRCRDAGHRAALRALLSRSARRALPGAHRTTTEEDARG